MSQNEILCTKLGWSKNQCKTFIKDNNVTLNHYAEIIQAKQLRGSIPVKVSLPWTSYAGSPNNQNRICAKLKESSANHLDIRYVTVVTYMIYFFQSISMAIPLNTTLHPESTLVYYEVGSNVS